MARKSLNRTFDAVLQVRSSVSFTDINKLLLHLGFHLERIRGSHHIYRHPVYRCTLNVQPKGKEAKPYQIRQLRDMIREYDMRLSDE